MDALELARLQFGIVTVYHFLFVPLSISLSFLVALMQTAWYRTSNPRYLAMTKFWGKLLLINFAMGVVTGIVQEFQFGMNWSNYSRFVGDVFGAPLALEAILAFMLEASFIGVWIFGWDRLPKWLHLLSIWLVAVGTLMSAFFILAANSWMQHPVGYELNAERGRAELTSLLDVLFNSTNMVAFPHVVTSAFVAGAGFIIGISAYHLARRKHVDVMRSSLKLGMWVALVAGGASAVSGDLQAVIMTEQQPMKMAAAEAIFDNAAPASFSVLTLGTPDGRSELFSIRIPYLLSFLAHHDFTAEVEGINNVQRDSEERFGPGDYRPVVWVTYWSFRWMIGLGMITVVLALLGLWLTRRGRLPDNPWIWRIALFAAPAPLIANSFGWIFTEMGRQPFVVYSLLFTSDAVSPNVPGWHVVLSLVGLTVLYLVLAVIEVGLIIRYVKAGPPEDKYEEAGDAETKDKEREFAIAY